MDASQKIIMLAGVILILASMSYADKGTATFYTKLFPSACYDHERQGSMIAAASDDLWDGGNICGTTITVRCIGSTNDLPHPCTGDSVDVKIVDYCPDCQGTIDLSNEAFTSIANPDAGKVRIAFDMN